MKPRTLSASSISVFELCAARWTAEYFLRGRGLSSSAADLGTACHNALERWVVEGHATDADNPVKLLKEILTEEYFKLFSDDDRLDEAKGMIQKWYNRTHPLTNEVLSAEIKENFQLKVEHKGDEFVVPFNYIWDRCDAVTAERCSECGNCPLEVEVVDYKTVAQPISPEGLKKKVQARCYAVAAQIKYPHAKRIWVTFDLLRHDQVGIVFTREENVETYRYLRALLKRILETDGNKAPETLNVECRWCVRKNVCGALQKHANVGGVLALADPVQVAEKHHDLTAQKAGIESAIKELEEFLLAHCEQEDVLEFDTDRFEVKVTASARRDIDSGRAAKIIGPELMEKYGKINMGSIDSILKSGELPADRASELRQLIFKKFGDPRIKVEPKNPIDG